MKPYYQDDAVTIYHDDCREVLPELPTVDLVLTDPPYGIGASQGTGGKAIKANMHQWESVDWDETTIDNKLMEMVLGKSEKCIIWGYQYMADKLGNTKAPLVWDKKCQNGWEDNNADIEIAWTRGINRPQCFRYQWMGACRGANTIDGRKVHPTQKPIHLVTWCIERVEKAQLILDPFMGSGTTLRAAKDLGRKAIGIEIEEKYCEIAANRMMQEVLDFEPQAEQEAQDE